MLALFIETADEYMISFRINEKKFLANDHIHDKIADTLQCVILNTLILGAGQTYSGKDPDEDRE